MTHRDSIRSRIPRLVRNRALALFLLASLLPAAPGCAPAPVPDRRKSVDAILAAAESLFVAMRERDYPGIWNRLTAHSKTAIVDATHRAIVRSGDPAASAGLVRAEFDRNGPLAREYWDGFLSQFDPSQALDRSQWQEVALDRERAQIKILLHGAKNPAWLQLFREEGVWKVGLMETFAAR